MDALQLGSSWVADVLADQRHQVQVAAAGLVVPERQRPVCPQRHERHNPGRVRGESLQQRLDQLAPIISFGLIAEHGPTIAVPRWRLLPWMYDSTAPGPPFSTFMRALAAGAWAG